MLEQGKMRYLVLDSNMSKEVEVVADKERC